MSEAASDTANGETIAVVRIVKPRGRKGEVLTRDLCGDDRVFETSRDLLLKLPDGAERSVRIEKAWRHQGRLVLKFEGVESISDAEELRGAVARIPIRELPPAEKGEHYYFELIGCTVVDAETDREIGCVQAIQEPGGSLLLEVRRGDTEILIPYEPPLVVDVNVEQKRIRVDLPEGLEDLNA